MAGDLAEQLRGAVTRLRTVGETPEARRELVERAMPRILRTLALLPPAVPGSRLLELGASPYITSACLDVVWPGTVTHANYFGPAAQGGTQEFVSSDGTRIVHTYAYDHFNIEVDEFPYPDATFDVVLFNELIEHLAINPLWALAEIHRVLKPEGYLLVTTPNALALERLSNWLWGGAQEVDKYFPAFGYGARHNREFQPAELRMLLEESGFDVEILRVDNLTQPPRPRLKMRLALAWLLSRAPALPREEHIFLRARRQPVFRWRFSERLFGHTAIVLLVRHPFVEMGVNDQIQTSGEWDALEQPPGEPAQRRVRWSATTLPGATVFLRPVAGSTAIRVRLRGVQGDNPGGARIRITVASAPGFDNLVALAGHIVPLDAWQDVTVPLSRPTAGAEPLRVTVVAERGNEVAVHRVEQVPA